jgi:hypothetical protein
MPSYTDYLKLTEPSMCFDGITSSDNTRQQNNLYTYREEGKEWITQ